MNEQVHPTPAELTASGYDTQQPPMGLIAGVGLGILATFVLIIVLIQAYFDYVQTGEYYQKVMEPIAADFLRLRTQEDAELNSYGYVDREKGIVRVPIDRAMQLTVTEYAEGRLFYPGQPKAVPPPEPAAPDDPTAPGAPNTPSVPQPAGGPNAGGTAANPAAARATAARPGADQLTQAPGGERGNAPAPR